MPKTIKVGPHVYSVLRKPKAILKGHGECDYNSLHISIQSRLRKSVAQETLLHEVVHTCSYPNLCGAGLITEEKAVETISHHLLGVLRDNPGLLEYLVG